MKKLILMSLMLSVGSFAWASIIVNGVDNGESYTAVDNGNETIVMTSGELRISSGNANVSSLTMEGGFSYLTAGKVGNLLVTGGLFEADATSGSINGGIESSGGLVEIFKLSTMNADIDLSGDARFVFHESGGNLNGKVTVEDTSRAYLDGSYSLNGITTNEFGKVISPTAGSFSGGGSNIKYNIIGAESAIYVGVIPEPAAISLIALFGVGALAARRIFINS
jgi:hypothetical protein